MPIKQNPSNVTGYPGQTLFFDLRSNGTVVPSWKTITGGTQDAARTLTYTSGGYVEGTGLYQLFSGNGQFAYTFSTRNLPTTGGNLRLKFQSVTTGAHYMELEFQDSGAVTLTTVAPDSVSWIVAGVFNTVSPPANGTTYTTTLTGLGASVIAGVRMIVEIIPFVGINVTIGTSRIEWRVGFAVGLGLFATPIQYIARMTSPSVSTPPLLVAPELVGDWRPGSAVAWTLSSTDGGQLTLPTSTSYMNNVGIGSTALPGTFTVTATQASVGGQALDDATATLTIAAFTVISDANVTMQPSEVRAFTTNFDDVATAPVTRTATGGTWSGLHYTAPSSGTSTLTFVAAGQTRTVTVTVVPTLSPAFEYVIPGETIVFTTTMSGTITWPSTLGGNSLTGSGASRTWVVPNSIGAMLRLSITNGTDVINRDLTVLEKFPYSCQIPLDFERGKMSVIEPLHDGTPIGRVKRKGNRATSSFSLNFENRDTTELAAAVAFLDKYDPQGRFIFEDTARTLRFACRLNGKVRGRVRTPTDCSYSFAVTED